MTFALVLDRARVARSAGKVLSAESFSNWLDAREVLREIAQHRSSVLTTLDREVENVLAEAYADGVARGKQEVAAAMVGTTARMEAAFLGLESRIVSTVMQTLEGMLGEMGPQEVLERQIRKVLKSCGTEPRLRLRVPSSAYELANSLLPEIIKEFPHVDFIDVAKDPSLAEGGCLLSTEFGMVDGSLDALLDSVREGLLGSIAGKRSHRDYGK